VFLFDVVPGTSYPIVAGLTWQFNGVAIGNLCNKVTVEFEQ
jgi:hypothetical protein